MKIALEGRIQTGSYDNKDGKKVYTFDVVVNSWEFAQSKGEEPTEPKQEEFVKVTEDTLSDEGLPFF